MATEGGAAPPAEGGVTKSAAKKAKSEAEKFFKKKSDPEGQALIEQGDAAMKEGEDPVARVCGWWRRLADVVRGQQKRNRMITKCGGDLRQACPCR